MRGKGKKLKKSTCWRKLLYWLCSFAVNYNWVNTYLTPLTVSFFCLLCQATCSLDAFNYFFCLALLIFNLQLVLDINPNTDLYTLFTSAKNLYTKSYNVHYSPLYVFCVNHHCTWQHSLLTPGHGLQCQNGYWTVFLTTPSTPQILAHMSPFPCLSWFCWQVLLRI